MNTDKDMVNKDIEAVKIVRESYVSGYVSGSVMTDIVHDILRKEKRDFDLLNRQSKRRAWINSARRRK